MSKELLRHWLNELVSDLSDERAKNHHLLNRVQSLEFSNEKLRRAAKLAIELLERKVYNE